MRDSFIFYRSFMEGLDCLNDQMFRRLVDAIMHYALDDKYPDDLNGIENAVFAAWKANIDASNRRRDAGNKGGRPKKPMVTESETIGYKTENHRLEDEKPNKNKNVNVNDNVNDNTNENVNVKVVKRFTPPTLQEVQEYCHEQGYSIDADRFIDFYASKGWVVGKTKMKDWKAAVRNWARSQRQEKTAEGQRQGQAANLNQRPYDYSELEKELLRRQAGIV